jgi:hypothetical protein
MPYSMKLADQLKYLRLRFQRRRLLTPSRLSIILCPLFALSATLAKFAVTLGGIFHLRSVHLGSLFILVVDYVGMTWWYWWLAGQMTEGRANVRRVSYYLSAMVFFLLIIAIMGTVWKAWVIALEVCYLCFPLSPRECRQQQESVVYYHHLDGLPASGCMTIRQYQHSRGINLTSRYLAGTIIEYSSGVSCVIYLADRSACVSLKKEGIGSGMPRRGHRPNHV